MCGRLGKLFLSGVAVGEVAGFGVVFLVVLFGGPEGGGFG